MYKIYEGETLPQAVLKMKIDLGKDAIIVDIKKIKKGGLFGFFGKTVHRVRAIAPKEEAPQPAVKKSISPTEDKQKILNLLQKRSSQKSGYLKKESSLNKGLNIVVDQPAEPVISKNVKMQNTYGLGSYKKTSENLIDSEIKELRSEIHQLTENMNKVLEKNNSNDVKYPFKLSKIYMDLIDNEVEENLSDKIVLAIKKEIKNKMEYNNLKLLQTILLKILVRVFPKPIAIDTTKKPQIVVLMGPTGVGKTTTIAKLGATYILMQKKKVAFITVDTYRLAAVEQLQKYSEILDAPLKVIFQPEELDDALKEFSDYDYILIDTAGRSQNDLAQMEELKHFVEAVNYNLNTFLVLQATTKFSDCEDIIQKFKIIDLKQIILTKIDETINLGHIISLVYKYKIPIGYVTNGQTVPDDIEVFEPLKLVKSIVLNNR